MREHSSRVYPEEPCGPFPTPPGTYTDPEGREIALSVVTHPEDTVRGVADGERTPIDVLTDMYQQFDPADRAQGIPPSSEDRIRRWLEPLLENGVNVVASHDGSVIGHATLVPDTDEPASLTAPGDVEWELAIFVLQDYQRGGIGTQLLEHLLGHASSLGIDRVWLTVERWNGPAISLYKRVGFELCGAESFEQEMSILLGAGV